MNAETMLRESLDELAGRAKDAPDLAARARAGVRRRRGRRSAAFVAGVLALTATAGLAQQTLGRAGDPVRPATSRSGPPCLGTWFDATDPQHAGDLLPADAVVVEALWCRAAGWEGAAVAEELRASTGLGPLLEVLRRPDDDATCAGVGHAYLWQLWVRTSDGRWLQPRWPRTPCGPTPEVVSVLDRIPFRTVGQAPFPRRETPPPTGQQRP